jgi:hypothetical protein
MGREKSPRIDKISWGQVKIEGFSSPFKDVKLFPGNAREWDWNETGTRHKPGIQPADVQELVDHGATIVILSTGMIERLQVRPETLQFLDKAGVKTHILNTNEAVQLYNELQKDKAAAALIHSTC